MTEDLGEWLVQAPWGPQRLVSKLSPHSGWSCPRAPLESSPRAPPLQALQTFCEPRVLGAQEGDGQSSEQTLEVVLRLRHMLDPPATCPGPG